MRIMRETFRSDRIECEPVLAVSAIWLFGSTDDLELDSGSAMEHPLLPSNFLVAPEGRVTTLRKDSRVCREPRLEIVFDTPIIPLIHACISILTCL